MNVCQLIGQLYDPDRELEVYYEGSGRNISKTPRVDFQLAVDRPSSDVRQAIGVTRVRCTLGGDVAKWFAANVTHGDVVALDGFVDCRILKFGDRKKVDMKVIVVHLDWVGLRRKAKIISKQELEAQKAAYFLEKQKEEEKVVDMGDTEEDEGSYDALPDWKGAL